ncbi:MAG: hypothetical protein AABP62_04690 [Planctomycetota bacterium]
MYVEFGANWSRIVAKLAQLKRAARGTNGLLIGDHRCLIYPGGKPNYPFHIKYPGFELYLSRKSHPVGEISNVFVSLSSELLWQCGEEAAIELVKSELSALAGGTVHECRMSRCDLAVDVLLPGGLTDDFIRSHAVSHAQLHRLFVNLDRLETMYVGGTGSDLLLRIYDKSTQIVKSEKLWFLPLWGLEKSADVWRFEFQVRRPVLKALGINSLSDLLARRADLWEYLTGNWFTLRVLDNPNASRRTIHPLWQMLQKCVQLFGPTTAPLHRRSPQSSLDPRRSIRQAAGALIGLAARTNAATLDDALQELTDGIRQEFESRSFEDDRRRKAIELGRQMNQEAA